MKKFFFTLFFIFGLPLMFNGIYYTQTCAELIPIPGQEESISRCESESPGPIVDAKTFFGGWLIVFAIFFLIFIVIAPFIIFGIVYEMLPNDSYLKHLMDIASIIFGILTLGLIYMRKKSK